MGLCRLPAAIPALPVLPALPVQVLQQHCPKQTDLKSVTKPVACRGAGREVLGQVLAWLIALLPRGVVGQKLTLGQHPCQ